uniref:Uncharacterized protein n=1 Tax=Daphnia magna TaxID=35525 RepID=A0A0P5XE78_9CRUS
MIDSSAPICCTVYLHATPTCHYSSANAIANDYKRNAPIGKLQRWMLTVFIIRLTCHKIWNLHYETVAFEILSGSDTSHNHSFLLLKRIT